MPRWHLEVEAEGPGEWFGMGDGSSVPVMDGSIKLLEAFVGEGSETARVVLGRLDRLTDHTPPDA